MKTQVQLYEIEEVRTETHEQSAEARALIEQLGLKGQQPALNVNDTSVITRFPYRRMTMEELFVFSILCPDRADLHEFSNEPIPLEVLKTAAFAKSLNDARLAYFEVWSAASAAVKDPVLVARASRWTSDNYILARWGAELLPLEVLLPDAITKWYAARKDRLNDIITRAQVELTRPMPTSAPRNFDLPSLSLS